MSANHEARLGATAPGSAVGTVAGLVLAGGVYAPGEAVVSVQRLRLGDTIQPTTVLTISGGRIEPVSIALAGVHDVTLARLLLAAHRTVREAR